jgi:hypothetical protein
MRDSEEDAGQKRSNSPKMDMQQMMQQLLARMDADRKERKAERIADRECMKQMMARTDDNQERDGDPKRMLKEMDAKIDVNQEKADGKQEEMLARMREEIKSGQAGMISTLDEWLMDLKDGRKETTNCNEATETKLDPGLMQSIGHQKIHKEDAAVMPVDSRGSSVGSAIWPRSAARRGRKELGEIADPGGSRLPPAGRCPAVQKWHGTRNAVMKDSRSNMDDERMRPGINFQEEPKNYERSEGFN